MKDKSKRHLLRLLGPALLVVVLYKMPNRHQLLELARAAMGWELALAVLLNVVVLALKVQRWRGLLKIRGIIYSFYPAWLAFNAVLYVGLLTPGRVGDVLRVRYLRRDTGASYADGLASIAVDRICDVYVLLAFVAVGVARFSSALAGELAVVTWVAVVLCAVAPLLLLVPGVGDPLMNAAWQRLSRYDATGGGMQRFLASLRQQMRRGFTTAAPLTAVAFVVNYVQGWLLARGMGLELTFLDIVSLLALASLFSLLPISVSGIGVRELLFAVTFPILGLNPQVGIGYGLLVFAVIYVPLLVYGFVCWQIAPVPLEDLERSEKKASSDSPHG